MDYSKVLSKIHLPHHLFGKYAGLLLSDEGKIHYMADKWSSSYFNLLENMEGIDDIRQLFDLSPYKRISRIPGIRNHDDPELLTAEAQDFKIFLSKKDPVFAQNFESFHTLLPDAKLFVYCRCPGNLYFALACPMGLEPQIYPSRLTDIIYVDKEDRLIGFSENFHDYYKSGIKDPRKMLGQPLSRFLQPTPCQIQRENLKRHPLPSPASLKEIASRHFNGNNGLSGLVPSHPECCRSREEGLVIANTTNDYLFLSLPIPIDTRRDFRFEVDVSVLEGTPPLVIVGDAYRNRTNYPDARGYLIGVHPTPSKNMFLLKRKGKQRCAGGLLSSAREKRLVLHKTGSCLRLFENGEEKLAYYDSDFLHQENAVISLGLRVNGRSLLKQIRLFAGESLSAPETTLPVILRLSTPEQYYFTHKDLDHDLLYTHFPTVSAFLLENITELQKQFYSLRRQHEAVLLEVGHTARHFTGTSPVMVSLRKRALTAAATDATILILGETGTGKEVLAREIHENSLRAISLFVKVDCSTLPLGLMESELFGHEKGAFTGAVDRRIGCFEQSDGGTLFLDEVANLSLEVQAKLLHFLQDRTISRVGGEKTIRLSVRIIIASNTPLLPLVERGLFRADLYYRMDVVTLKLPPLRERREDLPGLCRFFLQQCNQAHGKAVTDLSPEAYQKVFSAPWPGNIRELRNSIERAVIFCTGNVIGPELLSTEVTGKEGSGGNSRQYRFFNADPDLLRELIVKHNGVARKVAADLGVSIRALYSNVKRMGITMKEIRG